MIRKKCDILKLMVYRGIEMDNLTPDQRKKNMQHIRSDNTKIETILRKALWDKGYRYRKNYKDLPGKPDIVLTKYKIAIGGNIYINGFTKPFQKLFSSDLWSARYPA